MDGLIQRQSREDEQDLLCRVKAFLNGRHSLRNLRVEVIDDMVLVAGSVSTFHERQLAIECCKRVAGVRQVVDEMTVYSSTARLGNSTK